MVCPKIRHQRNWYRNRWQQLCELTIIAIRKLTSVEVCVCVVVGEGGVKKKKVGLDICVLHRSWMLWSVDLFVKYSPYGLNLYSLFDVPKYFIFLTAFHPPQFITHLKALSERGRPVGDGTLDICRLKDIESCGLCFYTF